jgi:hypothetical protein
VSWSERGRRAALALSTGEEREDDSLTVALLRDIHAVFSANGVEGRLQTSDLLAGLHGLEESPWSDWYGKPLSAHGLSRLLKPYRIKTMPVLTGSETVRGYKVEQFEDAFSRVPLLGSVKALDPSTDAGLRTNASDSESVSKRYADSAWIQRPNAPNAPNTHHAEGGATNSDEDTSEPDYWADHIRELGLFRRPLPGDPDFPDFVDGRFHAGHLTEEEWLERRQVHALVAGER